MNGRPDVLANQRTPRREGVRPGVFRGAFDPVGDGVSQLKLALVSNEARAEPLAVDRHVVGDALGDREPHGVRREHERAVLRERRDDRGQQRVAGRPATTVEW